MFRISVDVHFWNELTNFDVVANASAYRPIGLSAASRRSKHTKSMTPLNIARHLLYVYFRLRTMHCLRKRN